MRLKKEQIEAVCNWVAEGLESGEIEKRGKAFIQPFDISRQQVNYYRRTRHQQITELKETYENKALNTGLARVCIRVQRLQRLASLLEDDLFEKELTWVEDRKGVGTGSVAEIYDFYRFNSAEIETYRGILDDIAKEVGGRVMKIAPTDPTGTKEYGADARSALIGKLIPGFTLIGEGKETGEADG